MRVLSIQSHVSYGHVGNAAAIFALQRLGHEVWPVHTVNFATHTGYGPPTGTVADPETLRAIVARLDREGVLERCDAVLTGYVGSAATGDAILDAVATVRARNPAALWCCDPVTGDTGRGLFVAPEIAEFFARHAGDADILLPNGFEAAALTGIEIASAADAAHAVHALLDRGVRTVVLTGIETDGGAAIAALAGTRDAGWTVAIPKVEIGGRPNGAGDLFAAVFMGKLLDGRLLDEQTPAAALAHAAAAVRDVLQATLDVGAAELRLIEAQDSIVRPGAMPEPQRIW